MTDWISQSSQPSLAAAERAADAALHLARTRRLEIAIAVVDPAGQPICLKRMDAARPVTAELALSKARMAAIHRRETHLFQDLAAPGAPAFGVQFHAAGGAGILPGGLPVTSALGLHAAVGASGGDRDGDIACADATRAFLLNTLPE